MRKKKFIYAALALLILGFASCSQEEDFSPQEQEINLNITAGGVQTRVNTLGTGDIWESGDMVRLLRLSKDETGNNIYTDYYLTASVTNDVTTWTPDKKPYWDGKGEHMLVASYPNMDLAFDSFSIPSEQNTLSGLKEADCMNAMWKGTPTAEAINLNLKHRLSMVTVTYTLASEFESETDMTPEVYSNTQYIFFDVNTLERRDVAWQEGNDIWVKAYKHDELDADGNVVAKKFTAIVSPDAYNAGDEFIRVTIGDQVLTAKMKEDITFKEGTHYTFNLKVGKDKVTVEQISMNDFDYPFGDGWNNEDDLN